MKITLTLTLTLYIIISGWASQYRPGIMPEVVRNRQQGRAVPMLPQALPDVAGFVAWPYCADIGQIVELRIEGGPWQDYMIADCPHNDETQRWMLDNNILVEFSGETAARWGFVGRGVRVERRITTTRYKDFSFLKEVPLRTEIQYRDDVHQGKPGHPQCCFFEQFPSSANPDEVFHGALLCQMSVTEKDAERCKGDYLKCPLAYGGKYYDEQPTEPPTSMHDATPSPTGNGNGDDWIPF